MTEDKSKKLTAETPLGSIDFTHSIRRGLKRVYIRIERGGRVVLRSAPMPESSARSFIAMRAAWILATVEKSKNIPEPEPLKEISFLGKKYQLKRQKNEEMPVGRINLSFDDSVALAEYNPSMMRDELIIRKLEKFYRAEAEKTILPLVAKWSEIMRLRPTKVTFRNVKTRWGSCSSRGSLSFNINLVKAPIKCVEYVVVHELAHLRHHNHGVGFWAEVAKYLPDFAAYRDFLKNFRG